MADFQWNSLLDRNYVTTDDPQQLREDNNALLHHHIVTSTAPPSNATLSYFFDPPWRLGVDRPAKAACFELDVHMPIHFWLGDIANRLEDMGQVYSAVRDPLFFAYHANIDHIWGVYETLPGRRNFDDPDFLDAEFFFYNENAQLVRVTVADCLDFTKLGYAFEEVDNPWVSYNPGSVREVVPTPRPTSVS